VTFRRGLCRLGIGRGGLGAVYGWWGFSRASKILFGCIACSSFKWFLFDYSIYV
jgi:hypothetical protein